MYKYIFTRDAHYVYKHYNIFIYICVFILSIIFFSKICMCICTPLHTGSHTYIIINM